MNKQYPPSVDPGPSKPPSRVFGLGLTALLLVSVFAVVVWLGVAGTAKDAEHLSAADAPPSAVVNQQDDGQPPVAERATESEASLQSEPDLNAPRQQRTPPRAAATLGPGDPGAISGVLAEDHPDAARVMAALQKDSRDHAALSPMVQPEAFDRDAYRADPAAYFDAIRPGRALQPAQPGPDVPALTVLGARHRTVQPGESTMLAVRTQPHMPVTFLATDLGSFDNGLTVKSIAADAHGLASVRFTVTPGAFNHLAVVASSPVASGIARFLIDAPLPDRVAEEKSASEESPLSSTAP